MEEANDSSTLSYLLTEEDKKNLDTYLRIQEKWKEYIALGGSPNQTLDIINEVGIICAVSSGTSSVSFDNSGNLYFGTLDYIRTLESRYSGAEKSKDLFALIKSSFSFKPTTLSANPMQTDIPLFLPIKAHAKYLKTDIRVPLALFAPTGSNKSLFFDSVFELCEHLNISVHHFTDATTVVVMGTSERVEVDKPEGGTKKIATITIPAFLQYDLVVLDEAQDFFQSKWDFMKKGILKNTRVCLNNFRTEANVILNDKSKNRFSGLDKFYGRSNVVLMTYSDGIEKEIKEEIKTGTITRFCSLFYRLGIGDKKERYESNKRLYKSDITKEKDIEKPRRDLMNEISGLIKGSLIKSNLYSAYNMTKEGIVGGYFNGDDVYIMYPITHEANEWLNNQMISNLNDISRMEYDKKEQYESRQMNRIFKIAAVVSLMNGDKNVGISAMKRAYMIDELVWKYAIKYSSGIFGTPEAQLMDDKKLIMNIFSRFDESEYLKIFPKNQEDMVDFIHESIGTSGKGNEKTFGRDKTKTKLMDIRKLCFTVIQGRKRETWWFPNSSVCTRMHESDITKRISDFRIEEGIEGEVL